VATRFNEPTRVRKSLPLTEGDLAELDRLRQETRERAALSQLSGADVVDMTESALLHMIFVAGLHAISEKAEEEAYAAAAAGRLASGESEEIRRAGRRPRPAWADED
jgi:hypothetical protein